ncbi:MAG TPA: hypothetical protein VFB36_05235 [Nevskiaceae bacterium]|nr:hypothetical protein [Nevskiaceae bacterium]
MRTLLAALLVTLTGCASDAMRHCSDLAGAKWSRLTSPPPNAGELLAMEGLPNESDALWFKKGDDRLLACIYAGGLNSPACGAAMVYEYAKLEDHWSFRHMAMESCNEQ